MSRRTPIPVKKIKPQVPLICTCQVCNIRDAINCCNYCGKEFLRKDQLAAHVLGVHEDGHIYNCEKCNTKFNKK